MTPTNQDRQDVIALEAAFSALLDQRRFEAVAELFSRDAVLHRIDGSVARGRTEILAVQSARPEGTVTVHQMATPFVETDGQDGLKGWFSFVAVSIPPGGSPGPWMIGVIEDRYEREDGAWRISERRLKVIDKR